MNDKNPNIVNESIGFYYNVTNEQIEAHRKRSIKEILEWIESTNELIYKLQTKEEWERKKMFRT